MKEIKIKEEFATDYISRSAGERLRHFILDSLTNGESLLLDFTDITIASTSFFDEGIAKLIEEGISRKKFEDAITMKNLNPRDRNVLEKLCFMRKFT